MYESYIKRNISLKQNYNQTKPVVLIGAVPVFCTGIQRSDAIAVGVSYLYLYLFKPVLKSARGSTGSAW